MGVLGVKKRSSETGHPRRSMKARMSAGWGYPTESSGLPCGKFGVTAWKFRGYPVENSALPQAIIPPNSSRMYFIARWVIDEFCGSEERRLWAIGNRLGQKQWKPDGSQRYSCAEWRGKG